MPRRPAPTLTPPSLDRPPPGSDPAAIRRWGLGIALQTAAIAATGLSGDELRSRRRAGRAPADLTRSGTVDATRVRRAVHDTARAQLDTAVASGDLTDREARAMLSRIDHELTVTMGHDVRVPL